tara:strand:- start:1278 stop:2000 length:723 start_codon:yes stop_codon:yes gene_type:complete
MAFKFPFTFQKLENQIKSGIDLGYEFLNCKEYFLRDKETIDNAVICRVDIDQSIKKADILRKIFDKYNIKATFFVRLHANEYNPFSFENYRILKKIRDNGHEIGYHSEIVDQSEIWAEDAAECLIRDIKVLNQMLNIDIKGIASHGGLSGLNNLTFWDNKTSNEFNIFYEAYENTDNFNLFYNSLYVSESEWTQWKCYQNGILIKDDRRTFGEHLISKPKIIYLLIHPATWYEEYPYDEN